jgi:hypothetical protein
MQCNTLYDTLWPGLSCYYYHHYYVHQELSILLLLIQILRKVITSAWWGQFVVRRVSLLRKAGIQLQVLVFFVFFLFSQTTVYLLALPYFHFIHPLNSHLQTNPYRFNKFINKHICTCFCMNI